MFADALTNDYTSEQCLSTATISAPRFSYCQRCWQHGSSTTSRFSSLVHPLICVLNRNEVLLRLTAEILHVNPESSDLSAPFLQSRTRCLIKDTFNSRDSSSFCTPCQRRNFDVNTFQMAEWQDQQEAVTVHSARFLGWFPAVGGLASPPPSGSTCPERVWGCMWLDATGIWWRRPKMQINTIQDTGLPPETKNYPTPNVNGTKTGKPCYPKALGDLGVVILSYMWTYNWHFRFTTRHSFLYFCNYVIISHQLQHFQEASITRHLC